MTNNRFGIAAVLTGLAAAVAIAAVPSAAASAVDPTPVNTGDKTPVSTAGGTEPTQKAPVASGPSGQGTVALPPGGPVDILPQNQTTGGADPFVPSAPIRMCLTASGTSDCHIEQGQLGSDTGYRRSP
jgi:hypothetical protein